MTILRYFASFLFLQLMIICQTFTSLEAPKAPIPDGPQWHSLNTDNENNKHNFNTHRYNWLARDHIKTRSLNLCNIISEINEYIQDVSTLFDKKNKEIKDIINDFSQKIHAFSSNNNTLYEIENNIKSLKEFLISNYSNNEISREKKKTIAEIEITFENFILQNKDLEKNIKKIKGIKKELNTALKIIINSQQEAQEYENDSLISFKKLDDIVSDKTAQILLQKIELEHKNIIRIKEYLLTISDYFEELKLNTKQGINKILKENQLYQQELNLILEKTRELLDTEMTLQEESLILEKAKQKKEADELERKKIAKLEEERKKRKWFLKIKDTVSNFITSVQTLFLTFFNKSQSIKISSYSNTPKQKTSLEPLINDNEVINFENLEPLKIDVDNTTEEQLFQKNAPLSNQNENQKIEAPATITSTGNPFKVDEKKKKNNQNQTNNEYPAPEEINQYNQENKNLQSTESDFNNNQTKDTLPKSYNYNNQEEQQEIPFEQKFNVNNTSNQTSQKQQQNNNGNDNLFPEFDSLPKPSDTITIQRASNITPLPQNSNASNINNTPAGQNSLTPGMNSQIANSPYGMNSAYQNPENPEFGNYPSIAPSEYPSNSYYQSNNERLNNNDENFDGPPITYGPNGEIESIGSPTEKSRKKKKRNENDTSFLNNGNTQQQTTNSSENDSNTLKKKKLTHGKIGSDSKMQVEVGTMAPTQKETDTLLPFDQTPSLVKNVETRINQINANKTPVQIESVTYPQNLQDKELQSINDHSLPDIKITYQ